MALVTAWKSFLTFLGLIATKLAKHPEALILVFLATFIVLGFFWEDWRISQETSERLHEIRRELDQNGDRDEDVRRQAEEAAARSYALQRDLQVVDQTLQDLNHQVQPAGNQLAEVNSRLRDVESDLQDLKYGSMSSQLSASSSNGDPGWGAYEARLLILEREVNALRSQFDLFPRNHSTSSEALQNRLAQVEGEAKTLREDLTQQMGVVSALQGRIETLVDEAKERERREEVSETVDLSFTPPRLLRPLVLELSERSICGKLAITARLWIEVTANGKAGSVELLNKQEIPSRCHRALMKAGEAAVFDPARRNGLPIAVGIGVPVQMHE